MFLTIGICTWNRAKLLDTSLDAFKNVYIPGDIDLEILVVNNNSTDETDDIIEKHASNLPIRRLFEPQAGKSFALNHAAREARGDYILWTDDDAIVDKNWVKAYIEAFRRWPDAVFFGGPVLPWFEHEPPGWLTEETIPIVASAFAILDFEEGFSELNYEKLPYGVNMAVRCKEQKRYLYNTNYGPRPNSEIRGEETVLMQKLLKDGHEGRWVPKAKVSHHVPKKRMRLKYLKNIYEAWGELTWLAIENGDLTNSFGTFKNMLKSAVWTKWRYFYHRMFSTNKVWIRQLKISSMSWGRLKSRLEVKFHLKGTL